MKILVLVLTIIVFVNACNISKEIPSEDLPQSITTKYTSLQKIISKEVDDTFYVYLRLPKKYTLENKDYPVLYLLDGDIDFNMATSIVRYLQYGDEVPDLIIVGIGYGTMMDDNQKNFRERDYTFSKIDQLKQSGGADKFLNFLSKELVPFIDKNYRTNSKRILNGYSLGGLFSIYTYTKQNDLFDSFIAGSPYLKNDIDSLLVLAGNLIPNRSKLFVTVGEKESIEDYHLPIEKLVKQIKKSSEDKTNLKFRVFENGTHFTCPSEALTYGLQFVFGFDSTNMEQ